jgi:hypothetical protein
MTQETHADWIKQIIRALVNGKEAEVKILHRGNAHGLLPPHSAKPKGKKGATE